MIARRTEASLRNDYRTAIEQVKDKTKEFALLNKIELAKKFRLNSEMFKVLVQTGVVEMKPHGKNRLYRWALGSDPISDRVVDKVIDRTREIRNRYQKNYLKRKNGATAVDVKSSTEPRKKRKYTRRNTVEVTNEIKKIPVQHKGVCFGLPQLQFLKSMEFSVPTTVLFDNGCQFEGIRRIAFNVDKSNLTIDLFSVQTQTTILADLEERKEIPILSGKLPLVNKRLALSERFNDGKSGNLFVEILPI